MFYGHRLGHTYIPGHAYGQGHRHAHPHGQGDGHVQNTDMDTDMHLLSVRKTLQFFPVFHEKQQ